MALRNRGGGRGWGWRRLGGFSGRAEFLKSTIKLLWASAKAGWVLGASLIFNEHSSTGPGRPGERPRTQGPEQVRRHLLPTGSAWQDTDGVLLRVPGEGETGQGSEDARRRGGAFWTRPWGGRCPLRAGGPPKARKTSTFVGYIRTAPLDKWGWARSRVHLGGFRHHLRGAEGGLYPGKRRNGPAL